MRDGPEEGELRERTERNPPVAYLVVVHPEVASDPPDADCEGVGEEPERHGELRRLAREF